MKSLLICTWLVWCINCNTTTIDKSAAYVVSVHCLCVHSGAWCSSAVTIGKLRPRPQSLDISCQMSPIGWVERPNALLWDGCDLSCLQLGDIPMVKSCHGQPVLSMGHRSQLVLYSVMQCTLRPYNEGRCRTHRASPWVELTFKKSSSMCQYPPVRDVFLSIML